MVKTQNQKNININANDLKRNHKSKKGFKKINKVVKSG